MAAHICQPSAKGQMPFHPVSMYLLSLYRRQRNLSYYEVVRVLRHRDEGRQLRHHLGSKDEFLSPSRLRYFEGCITPKRQ
jgi:hypothetical protein